MKNKLIILICLIMILSLFAGCTDRTSVDSKQREQTERLMEEVNNKIGMPDVTNFYEKGLLKELYELRDDSELICYAYTVNLDGQYIYQGICIGYGLPYAVQFSNPEKLVNRYGEPITGGNYEAHSVPQAEPNGLFMPDALSATWLIMINEDTGELEPMYCEPMIIVRQSKAPRRLCAEWSLPRGY